MTPKLRLKFENILAYPFFKTVGEPLPSCVTPVTSWQRAVEECSSLKWENCTLMAGNALQRFVQRQYWERFQVWEPLSDELRPAITSFVASMLPKTVIPPSLIEKARPQIAWDIMCICLEHEFNDIVEPLFYIPLLDPWYAAGHFPCGWEGEEFPEPWDGVIREGRLMVF